jgi:aspartyl-tRNA(Asn)/glutamyl-tRNA(Gln) amidotransferase subunit C
MSITKSEVLAVARLARLHLDGATAERMTAEMDAILAYVHKLDELDTRDVPPTAQVSVDAAPLRPDVVLPGVEKLLALAEAPRSDSVGFLVPGFVDES